MGQNDSQELVSPLREREIVEMFSKERDTPDSPMVLSTGKSAPIPFRLMKSREGSESQGNIYEINDHLLREILYYVPVNDLLNIFLSCQSLYGISCTNTFWSSYFRYCFGDDRHEKVTKREKENVKVNWKREFYVNYFQLGYANDVYRRRFPLKADSGRIVHNHFIVIGDRGIGKKSLVRRLITNKYNEDDDLNHKKFSHLFGGRCFLTFDSRSVGTEEHKILINIFSPQTDDDEETRKNYDYWIRNSRSYLLCFSFDNRQSFLNLEKYAEEIVSKSDDIGRLNFPTKSRYNVLVVGLRGDIDLEENREVKRDEVLQFVEKHKLKGLVETSAKNDNNVFLPFGILMEKSILQIQPLELKLSTRVGDVANFVKKVVTSPSLVGEVVHGVLFYGYGHSNPWDAYNGYNSDECEEIERKIGELEKKVKKHFGT